MNAKSKRMMATAAGTLRLLLMVVLAGAGTLSAANWQLGVLDPTGGMFPALRTDRYGNEHLVYMDGASEVLKYSFWDHRLQKWFTTALDRSSGFCSLALDSNQFPHISYLDYGRNQLRYAYWNGSIWQKQTIEIGAKNISFYTSLALDSKDRPSISFYEYDDAEGNNDLHLRVVTWTGSMWEVRTADATRGSGKFNSLAIDSTGNPQLAYADVSYENSSLRYAHWDGHSWNTEILEGADGPRYIHSVSVVLDSKDNPHIVYADVMANPNEVKYATRKDGKWQFETVDTLAREAFPDRFGFALDEQGNPYVSYCDVGSGELRVAYRRDQKWVREVVDRGFACYTSSLQVNHGTIWVVYGTENSAGPLKLATKMLDVAEDAASDSKSPTPAAPSEAPSGAPAKTPANAPASAPSGTPAEVQRGD